MKKIINLVIAFTVFSTLATAQERLLSIDDIFDAQKRLPFSGKPVNLRGWTSDGKAYLQIVDGSLIRVDAVSGEQKTILDVPRMADLLIRSGFQTDTAKTVAASPSLVFDPNYDSVLFSHERDIWVMKISDGAVRRLTKDLEDELEAGFSPDGRMVSFIRKSNLFVVDPETGRERQITRDGNDKILNGYLDWVYEEELYGRGNKRGYWWSPDSRLIAFLRTDVSQVPKFVLVDDMVTDQRIETTTYPQSGDANPTVRLAVAEISKNPTLPNVGKIPGIGSKLPSSVARFGDSVTFVDLSRYKSQEFLISKVSWTPDSRQLVFQAQDREQTYLDLNLAETKKGKVKNILIDRTRAWVSAIDDPIFIKDGTFFFLSERDGFKHLYHFNAEGKFIGQITKGKWEISEFYGIDEPNGFAYFSAVGEGNDWINTHIYRIKLDGTGIQRLTSEPGTHRAVFNNQFSHFIGTWNSASNPTQTRLHESNGTVERVIDENRTTAAEQFKLSSPEFMKVKARDGFEMEAMMIKPADFDPNRKYPVLAYTYSGPQAPQVRNRWGGGRYMWHQMMAQKGYIIWICDNRTGSGKGAESAWEVYRRMGESEVQDLEDGFNYLKSLPYVDSERLGMWGWSYGGYMTSYFMTHSATLKMGIAGGMVGDWSLYDSIYTERYMLLPKNNRQGYAKSSVIENADKLSGRLLLIHGTMDENVHMQNSMKFAYALQKAGKQFDFMPYPTQRHGIVDPQQAKHMYTMMTEYIQRNL